VVKDIFLVGLIRDGARTIRSELLRLHHLLSDIAPTTAFVVESDSRDTTLDVLAQMKDEFSWFDYHSFGDLSLTIPIRTERLAYCRNAYRDVINAKALDGESIVIAVDLDMRNDRLTTGNLENAIYSEDWDIITANQDGPYYDVWTLRHPLLSPNDYKLVMETYQEWHMSEVNSALRTLYSRMVTIPPNIGRIPVDSAFGGLAIYRPHVFKVSKYSGFDSDGNEVSDHVPFNEELRKHGYKIFIYTDLLTTAKNEHSSLLTIARKQIMSLLKRK